MPPTSRRKKQYDEQLRGFQNRNILSGLLLLVFVGLAIWLAIRLMPGAKPAVFVSTNYIDHSGSRKIPFAEESCQLVLDAFGQHVKSELPKVHQVDQQDSQLELPKERLGENGVLVVYLNGHLVDKSLPDSDQVSVGYLAPEATLNEKDLGNMLVEIDKSPAKLKLVFLDAGRYSWSPVYPSRSPNEFSSSLAKALKNQHWGPLSDNFWIIVSHSDQEISRVSTPLKSSLFAKAIAESVAQMADSGQSKLGVIELFENISQRTTSWSRNFKNQSLQTPVLIRAGTGVVTDENADEYRSIEFAVNWNNTDPDSNANAKPPAEPVYTWESFASRMSGDEVAKQMLAEDLFDAVPFKAVQGIESFLELGSEFDAAPDSDDYQMAVENAQERPEGNTLYDKNKWKDKREHTRGFRQAIFGVAILDRFQNEIQFWEDDKAINQLKMLGGSTGRPDSSSVTLDDSILQEQQKLPATVDPYIEEVEDYQRRHSELVKLVEGKLRLASKNSADRDQLTPTQAELLGRASQRYLPLISAFDSKTTTDTPAVAQQRKDETDRSTLVFNLNVVASTSKFGLDDGLSITDLHEKARRRIAQQSAQPSSDTSYRLLLAAGGSESAGTPRGGVAPRISWDPVEPNVLITSSEKQFRVNPFDMDPLSFSLSAQAVELVTLSLSMDGEEIPKLDFGFNPKFEDEMAITFEDVEDMSRQETKGFEVYIRHRSPGSLLGQPLKMKLLATAAKGAIEPMEFPFTVQLSKDPTVQLLARREIGVGEAPATQASLIRWGGKLPENWVPMTINSLANVRSAFQLSLVNNTSRPKTLRAELYNVVELPPEFGSSQIYAADRPNRDQVQVLASWLFRQQELSSGATSLQESNRDFLALVAETQPIAVPSGGNPVPALFSVPLVGEKKEPTEASLQDQGVEKGMLVVFYEKTTEDAPEKLAWFQWVSFEPKEPADATAGAGGEMLRPLLDVLDVFQEEPDLMSQSQRSNTETMLTKAWIPGGTQDKPEPAATLTTVSEGAYQQNRHFEDSLSLKSIFQSQSLSPKSSREYPALLLMDLLGVPNYGIFERRGDSINQAGFRKSLTGVRIESLPGPAWKCYPQTWSLVGASEILNRGTDSQVQEIYLKGPENAETGPVKLELLLPIGNGVLAAAENDFELRWRGGDVSKLFPNQREHFFQATETGLNFWSIVSAHTLVDTADSFANESVLEIRRAGSEKLLGSWRFITEPPTGPEISVRLSKDSVTEGQLPQVTVDIDLSQFKPPINLKTLNLLVDEKGIKNPARFLQARAQASAPGKFRFPYSDLVKELGGKKIGSHRIEIKATTFFDETTSDFASLEIKPNPKPSKVKTKPTLSYARIITLKFEDAAGDPFQGVTKFKSIIVDEVAVPRLRKGNNNVLTPGVTAAAGSATEEKVVIYEIKEGTHEIKIIADVGGDEQVFRGQINVRKNGQQVFKLKPSK